MYLEGTSPRTWRLHTVCVYILKVYLSVFLLFLLEVYKGNAWTITNIGTRFSLGSGRFPKKIGPNTRPGRGTANIVGSGPPILCAWNNTGAGRDLTKYRYSALKPHPNDRQLPSNLGLGSILEHNKPRLGSLRDPSGDFR
jgi:hypothetical protein